MKDPHAPRLPRPNFTRMRAPLVIRRGLWPQGAQMPSLIYGLPPLPPTSFVEASLDPLATRSWRWANGDRGWPCLVLLLILLLLGDERLSESRYAYYTLLTLLTYL